MIFLLISLDRETEIELNSEQARGPREQGAAEVPGRLRQAPPAEVEVPAEHKLEGQKDVEENRQKDWEKVERSFL